MYTVMKNGSGWDVISPTGFQHSTWAAYTSAVQTARDLNRKLCLDRKTAAKAAKEPA